MMGLLTSMIGGRGGRMLGGMIGGRTGAMIGGMLGSMVGSRQLGRLARSAMAGRGDDDRTGGGGGGRDLAHAGGAAPADVFSETEAQVLVRAMCNAAKADGSVDQDEADRITAQLGDDVTAAERSFLTEQLTSPFLAPSVMAGSVPADLAAETYAVSIMAIDVDTAEESDYLAELARSLGLSDADRNEIHTELGVDA